MYRSENMDDDERTRAHLKRFLDVLETSKLCEIARSVYGGHQPAYTREVAENLLLDAPYLKVLTNKKLPTLEILKFLILNGAQVEYNMSKEELCSHLIAFITKQTASPQTSNYVNDNKNLVVTRNNPPVPDHQVPVSESINTQYVDYKQEQQVQNFIDDFSNEFYVLLNNLGTSESNQLGIRHFFNYSIFNLKIINIDMKTDELINDPLSILQSLINLKTCHQLYFSPYLKGMKWEKDIHGLIKILIGGKLYQRGECVGTFEQLFSLGQDFQKENVWKILNSSMVLMCMVKLLINGLSN